MSFCPGDRRNFEMRDRGRLPEDAEKDLLEIVQEHLPESDIFRFSFPEKFVDHRLPLRIPLVFRHDDVLEPHPLTGRDLAERLDDTRQGIDHLSRHLLVERRVRPDRVDVRFREFEIRSPEIPFAVRDRHGDVVYIVRHLDDLHVGELRIEMRLDEIAEVLLRPDVHVDDPVLARHLDTERRGILPLDEFLDRSESLADPGETREDRLHEFRTLLHLLRRDDLKEHVIHGQCILELDVIHPQHLPERIEHRWKHEIPYLREEREDCADTAEELAETGDKDV